MRRSELIKQAEWIIVMIEEPWISNFDRHLIGEGTHGRAYEKLGAHLIELNGVSGVHFAVWAPNASSVSVIGDFNDWQPDATPMARIDADGIWTCFVAGLTAGVLYKYHLASALGLLEKADPYAFASEMRPQTASVVVDLDAHRWGDAAWLSERANRQALDAPLSIYEVHLGSWRRVPGEGDRQLSYRELADQLIPYVAQMGFTHIELLPISEHPFDGSWGYQPTGYFAPTSRFGAPADFMAFVDRCHQQGIGVILDWVPAHFPKDAIGLGMFDGTHLYEHADPRQGEHQDWGTLIFNYGRNEVRAFLLSNGLFWLDKYHIDGLRVDAVASMLYLDYSRLLGQWIPNRYGGRENLEAIEFLKQFNILAHQEHPGVLTIAEESTAWPQVSRPVYRGGLGFSLKWNMGWMHDMLNYMSQDPLYRRYNHSNITFSLMYAFSENYVLPLSHDEVVHLKGSLITKMPGDAWQKFANLRAFFGFMYGHPGKKLLFMGGEFGQWHEWDHDAGLDWYLLEWPSHRGLQRYLQDLNRLYQTQPAFYENDFDYQGFEWIDFRDSDNSVIVFLRHAHSPDDDLVFVCNFTPLPRFDYHIGVPRGGYYRELLNSDAAAYWGSNLGNNGGVWADTTEAHGRPYSLRLTLPPLATLVLKADPVRPAIPPAVARTDEQPEPDC
jgi:1,4-alpha-glucan branching enzyme